jgi:uncharacterized protein (DUF983 family)
MGGGESRPFVFGATNVTNPETSFGSTVWRGIVGRCPSCGQGKLFRGYLTLAERCNHCGLNNGFADAGDGAIIFVILVAGFILVGGALFVEVRYAPPYWVHAILWGPLAILVTLGLLRPFKGILIALQFKHKAQEGRLASE